MEKSKVSRVSSPGIYLLCSVVICEQDELSDYRDTAAS